MTDAPLIEKRKIVDRAQWLRWRVFNVNASEAPALVADGIHPYRTAFELWAHKSGLDDPDLVDTPEKRRGRDLEAIVVDMVREQSPDWEIVYPVATYYVDQAARIGATPDALVYHPNCAQGVLQIKTANEWAFRKYWRNADGEVEVPIWIAIQATIEADLTGSTVAHVGVLEMAAWAVHLLPVTLKPALMDKLRALVADFWLRVDAGDYYPANWEHDAGIIARLFAEAEDREIDLSADNRIVELLKQRDDLQKRITEANAAGKERKALDAEILLKIGTAERARLADGRTLWAPTRRRAAYQAKATSWREISIKERANGTQASG